MSEKLSIRLDTEARRPLDALARQTGCSKSVLAVEAISQYIELQEWPLAEIEAGARHKNG
jgi:predicted transcriptional regulator